MEASKFEKDIREKLGKREIKPSAESWNKLEGRLEKGKEPSKPRLWWIGVAAAIATVFFVLGSFFGNSGMEENPVVVEENPSEEIVPQDVERVPEKKGLVGIQKGQKQETFQAGEVLQKDSREEIQIATKAEKENNPPSPQSLEIAEVVPEKPTEAFAEASKPATTSTKVTDAEIDALLEQATAELDINYGVYTQTATAKNLLNEVEYELEESFRQKVFEVLKEGFSKAKTAVANRNF